MKLFHSFNAIGASGKVHSFSLFTKDTKFREVGAVYMFLIEEISHPGKVYSPLYIGQTSNLHERISNHEKWDCVNFHGCTHIAVKHVPCEDERLDIETDLRRTHPTVCNDQ